MVISYHFLCEDLVHHPIETSNKKWLALGFQVDVVLPLSIITSVCVCVKSFRLNIYSSNISRISAIIQVLPTSPIIKPSGSLRKPYSNKNPTFLNPLQTKYLPQAETKALSDELVGG